MKLAFALPGRLLDAYGALFLARWRAVGALVLVATWSDPVTASMGSCAALAALALRATARLPAASGETDVLNAIYAGLALGAFYGNSPLLLALAAFGGGLALLLGIALGRVLRGADGERGLPLLGAPFLLTAWTLFAIAKGLALPWRWAWPAPPAWLDILPAGAGAALSAIGSLFYVAQPQAGLLILVALVLASRAMALLAVAGALLAQVLVTAVATSGAAELPLLAAFNGALVAIFLGAALAAPSLPALLVAALGVIVSSALAAALLALCKPFGLPPLSAPFLLTVWLARAALRPEHHAAWARFWLSTPACPERSLVSGRLAAARGLAAGSVGLLPPFYGAMRVAQGCDGEITHRGPWRYALDFIRSEDGYSYRRDGTQLIDFLAFDQPVLAPAAGCVVSCRDDIADNPPGRMNLVDNWGNYLLIDIGGGLCVLLAHLRQHSLSVATGQRVSAGMMLARIGNSGRSAQPHLHLHLQRGARLGAATLPFHLSHCLVDGGDYALDSVPAAGQSIELAIGAEALANACQPLHGRVWQFRRGQQSWPLAVLTDVDGITRLTAPGGAGLNAVAGPGLLALYGRHGAADSVLDAFALAYGLTPFSARATRWRDAADASLLPLPWWLRLAVVLRHPFGANLDSRYQRHWDAAHGLWRQTGHHHLSSVLGRIEAESIGWLSESVGPVAFSLRVAGHVVCDAALAGYGNHGDHGVPAWSAAYLGNALS